MRRQTLTTTVLIFAVLLLGACEENPINGGKDDEKDEIAFHTGEALYVMDLSNNSTRKVTEPLLGGGRSLRWSPDGKRIAYEAPYGGWEGNKYTR